MRKFYILLAAMATATLSQAAVTVPYSSEIASSSSAISPEWTVRDANNDGSTWSAYSGGVTGVFSNCVRARYSTSKEGNDWIISPAVTLQGGKEYMVVFYDKCQSSSDIEHLSLYATPVSSDDVPSADEMKTGKLLYDNPELKYTSWAKQGCLFTPETDGDYRFGFYYCSPKYKYYAYVGGFQIVANEFAPAAVDNLKAVGGANRAMTVDLTWDLPTKTSLGLDLTPEQTVEKVLIYRDDAETPVATLTDPANMTSWQDTEATGLTGGFHTYSVVVEISGTPSPRAEVRTPYIGPVEPMSLPFVADLSSADNFASLWSVFRGEASTTGKDWTLNPGMKRIDHTYTYGKVEDDWVSTPPLKVTVPGIYKVTLSAYTGYGSSAYNLSLYLGSGCSPQLMTTKLAEITSGLSSSSSYPTTLEYFVEIPDAGTYYIGAQAAAQNSQMTLYITQLDVEESEHIPAAVTDLAYTSDYDLNVNLSWTLPTTALDGASLEGVDYSVVVIRGTEEIATLPSTATSYTDKVDAPGVYDYTVKTVTPKGGTSAVPAKLHTGWVGDATTELPYSTTFNKSDISSQKWTAYDANHDGNSWELQDGSWRLRIGDKDEYDLSNNNDYLVSPPFDLQPGYYNISSSFASKNTPCRFVLLKKNTDITGAEHITSVEFPKGTNSGWASKNTLTINVEEEGKYYVAFQVYDATVYLSSTNWPEVEDFSIAYLPVLPGVATNLTVTPDPDRALKATISWINPAGTNVEGVSTELTKAVVLRDGVEIATITEGLTPGEASSYLDETIPAAGAYSYQVEVYNANGKSETAATKVRSSWIGGGASLENGIIYGKDNENGGFQDWTLVNKLNGTSPAWEANSAGTRLSIMHYNNKADAWAISPYLEFEAGEKYIVKVSGYSSSGSKFDLDLAWAPSDSYSDMTTIGNVLITTGYGTTDTKEYYLWAVEGGAPAMLADEAAEDIPEDAFVTIPAGVNTLGLHAATDKSESYVNGFEIAHHITEGVEEVIYNRDLFSVANGAVVFGSAATGVKVYNLAGALVLAPGNVDGTLSLEALPAGAYVVKASVACRNISAKVVK